MPIDCSQRRIYKYPEGRILQNTSSRKSISVLRHDYSILFLYPTSWRIELGIGPIQGDKNGNLHKVSFLFTSDCISSVLSCYTFQYYLDGPTLEMEGKKQNRWVYTFYSILFKLQNLFCRVLLKWMRKLNQNCRLVEKEHKGTKAKLTTVFYVYQLHFNAIPVPM